MDIALLNTKITFKKQHVVVDEIGNHIEAWDDFYSCFATISGEGGGETFNAAQTNDHSDISFTVRYCSAVAEVDTLSYRIECEAEIYDILAIDHMGNKKQSLKFRCQKVKR